MGTTVALFDIDGTIFRDSLAVEHFKYLVKHDVIPKEAVTHHLFSMHGKPAKRIMKVFIVMSVRSTIKRVSH